MKRIDSNKEILNYLKQRSEVNRQIAFDIAWKIENIPTVQQDSDA